MALIDATAAALGVAPAPWEALLNVLDERMTPEEESDSEAPIPEHARDLLVACRRAVSRVAADVESQPGQIFVYTVFQAKGQEWDHVFLAGAYQRAFRDQGDRIGEGTRLLYVALTRACESMTITKFNSCARNRGLIAATGTGSPSFPSILVDAANAAGVPIEALGPQP